MTEPIDWAGLFADYASVRSAALSGLGSWKPFKLPKEAVRRATSPTRDDLGWMTEALGHEERKWFVAEIYRNAKPLPEGLLTSMLDAGIDEVNPSLSRSFIEPVVRAFGHRRVIEYLLRVVETDTDFRRAGAVNEEGCLGKCPPRLVGWRGSPRGTSPNNPLRFRGPMARGPPLQGAGAKANDFEGLKSAETSPTRSAPWTRSSFRTGAPGARSSFSSRTQTTFGLVVDSK
jgi:hypothetical protein